MPRRSIHTSARQILCSIKKNPPRSAVSPRYFHLGSTSSSPPPTLLSRGTRKPLFAVTSGAVRSLSHNIETLRLLTQRILEMEGPLSPKAWAGAETAFDMWTLHPVTHEGAKWGWKLLDRLVEDERQNCTKRLTVGWLRRMVGVYAESKLAVDPEQVMARLERYVPVLSADAQTISMLQGMKKLTVIVDGQEQSMELPAFELEAFENGEEASENSSSPLEKEESSDKATESNKTKAWTDEARTQNTCDEKEWEKFEQRLLHHTGSDAFHHLDRLIKEKSLPVTTEWLNRVVQVWCDKRMVEPSQLLLKLNDYAPLPDASTYDIIVSAVRGTSFLDKPVGSMTQADWNEAEAMLRSMTNTSATPDSISSAWKLLDRLVEEEKCVKEESGSYKSQLRTDWLNRVVEAWCRCFKGGSSEDATKILVQINSYAPHVSPDPYIYQMIVESVSKSKQSSRRAVAKNEPNMKKQTPGHDRRYIRMTEKSRQMIKSASNPVPTTAMYHEKIQKLSGKCAEDCDPHEAERLLDEMWELYNAGNLTVKPNIYSYNLVLKVLVDSRHRNSGERAEALLRRMQELNDAGDDTVKPDVYTFTTCMAAWSNSGHPIATEKAEALFRLMQTMYEAGDTSLKPDTFAYTALLTALSRGGDSSAGDRAQAVLTQMQKVHENGDANVKPDTVCYNMVLKAFVRSHGINKAERAERADSMLALMEKEYAAGNESVKPNFISFTTVISAWSRCQDIPQAGDRAENVLNRMEAFYEAGNEDSRPSRYAYNGVISAHMRSGGDSAAEKAEMVLDRIEKLVDGFAIPNISSFNVIIAAYAKQGGKAASLKAEALLNRMQQLQNAGNFDAKPDAVTYMKIALAWVNSNDKDAAANAIRYLETSNMLGGCGAKKELEAMCERIMNLLLADEHTEAARTEVLKERLRRLQTEIKKSTEASAKQNSSLRSGNDHASSTETTSTHSTSVASG